MKPKNSLERVLAVLEVFSEERLEWTPEDLMRELGYSRPTLYRYLKILKDAGFLMSTRNAGVTLGPRVVEMDYLTRRADPLVLAGVPYLKQLTAAHSCTAMVLRWYGNKILCVASESSTKNPISPYPGVVAAATPDAADRAQSRRPAPGWPRRHRRRCPQKPEEGPQGRRLRRL